MKMAIKIIVGIACGGIVGFALGVASAMSLGLLSTWSHPNDPSAGSVAIVVIATAPLGAIAGAILGSLTFAKRPRFFLTTFLPLAIGLIVLQCIFSSLRQFDRPRRFVLEVMGTPAAGFAGAISVDGQRQQFQGKIPAKFEFTAFRIESAFALVNSNGENSISVKTSADGNDLTTGTESPTGVRLSLESFGYSERFGGTTRHWKRMSPEEVDHLLNEEVLPRGLSD